MSVKKMFYSKRWVSRFFFMAVFVLVWELTAKLSNISPLLLPPVEKVAEVFASGLFNGPLLDQTLFSLGVILLGLLISIVLALLMGIVSRMSPFLERMMDALTVMGHPLPGMALLPLIVIWFGTGLSAVTAVIVHACLWPLYVNLYSGMQNAPSVYGDLGRNFSMSRFRIALEILLPAAFSQILSGLRIGWARVWRALISAEMVFGAIGQTGGLGWYIFKQRTMMNTAGLFAGILAVALIGMAVEGLVFEKMEKVTIVKWGALGKAEEQS